MSHALGRALARVVTPGTAVALAALALSAPASPASAAPAPPAPPAPPPVPTGLPASMEGLAPYVAPNSCHAPYVGTARLGALLVKTYRGTTWNGPRDCTTSPPNSEHMDGRAIDWMTSVRTAAGRANASSLIGWLLASDRAGNPYANARRLGVMYVIWNNRIWSSYRAADGWRDYNGCTAKARAKTTYDTTCHRNHVHLSLSWAGASGATSYWTKRVAALDYGPCRKAGMNWATRWTKPRTTRCPAYPRVTAKKGASALRRTLVAYSGMRITSGMRGPAVRAVQKKLKLPVTGVWDARSRTAIRTYKGARGIKVSSAVTVPVWRTVLSGAS